LEQPAPCSPAAPGRASPRYRCAVLQLTRCRRGSRNQTAVSTDGRFPREAALQLTPPAARFPRRSYASQLPEAWPHTQTVRRTLALDGEPRPSRESPSPLALPDRAPSWRLRETETSKRFPDRTRETA